MTKTPFYTVVGGAGFIGTRLCQLMADRGLPFEVVDLKRSKRFSEHTVIADIRDIDALRAAVNGDVIINLAAVHRDDVRDASEYYTTNVDGTKNVCVIAAERGANTLVFTSTVAIYGFAPPDTDEAGAANPFNDYGRSKLQAEHVLREWQAEAPDVRNLAIVRPTVVFGEGNRGNVYNLLNQIASGRFLMVGDGTNRKSMAYVGNLAAYLLHAAMSANGCSLTNYVDKPDFTMNNLVMKVRETLTGRPKVGPRLPYALGLMLGYIADIAARVLRRSLPISSIRVKKFCATTAFSSAAHEQPGFEAPFTLEQGLERTLKAEFLDPNPDREIFFTE